MCSSIDRSFSSFTAVSTSSTLTQAFSNGGFGIVARAGRLPVGGVFPKRHHIVYQPLGISVGHLRFRGLGGSASGGEERGRKQPDGEDPVPDSLQWRSPAPLVDMVITVSSTALLANHNATERGRIRLRTSLTKST